MFPTLARRVGSIANRPMGPKLRSATRLPPTSTSAAPDIYVDPRYKPKKVWPPDFSLLSDKEKFRFEKRYKRRIKLATARPRWNRYVQLAQLGIITTVIIYAVLFMEWETKKQPFERIRKHFWGFFGASPPEHRHDRQRPVSTTDHRN
ncbi:hypothetical protein F5B18DRAFT_350712 [Nemania serpens]|nr:hypothetical protein F5B18DRAFT_350712 [Nemania serpens]